MAGAQKRSVVLFGALAATLAATGWVASRDDTPDDFGPVARAASPRADQTIEAVPEAAVIAAPPALERSAAPHAANGGTEIDLGRLKREIAPSEQPADDAFAQHTWYVPPPPLKPAPPPRPMAPALPFKFMGRLHEGGKEVVFITNNQDRNYAVSSGDTIEGNYRVESITEHAMTLTYLPLGQQQTLQLGQ